MLDTNNCLWVKVSFISCSLNMNAQTNIKWQYFFLLKRLESDPFPAGSGKKH